MVEDQGQLNGKHKEGAQWVVRELGDIKMK
jgi:hypothetical protein